MSSAAVNGEQAKRGEETAAREPARLLVFAHVPPPHHGQSYMVQLMLEGLRRPDPSRPPIECYHVDARVSRELADIGDFRVGKFLLLLGYCAQAIYYRFRHGVSTFYYVPAPGKHSALYRDWVVMALCRPFFKHLILHWHAAGLGKWLETRVQMRTRAFTYNLLRQADLSIVLSQYNRRDAEKLLARRIAVVGNGIPDPCPDYEPAVKARRSARRSARLKLLAGETPDVGELRAAGGDPQVVRVLFLAHCTREKGLFDALEGVCRANAQLARRPSRVSLRLQVAGNFLSTAEQHEFEQQLDRWQCRAVVEYQGFVGQEKKGQLLREADLFCFPTYYGNENQPVNLIEALAFGLPIVTTRWRSLPEFLPAGYPGLVPVREPEAVAGALLRLLEVDGSADFRQLFLRHYTIERHLHHLAEAFHSVAGGR